MKIKFVLEKEETNKINLQDFCRVIAQLNKNKKMDACMKRYKDTFEIVIYPNDN